METTSAGFLGIAPGRRKARGRLVTTRPRHVMARQTHIGRIASQTRRSVGRAGFASTRRHSLSAALTICIHWRRFADLASGREQTQSAPRASARCNGRKKASPDAQRCSSEKIRLAATCTPTRGEHEPRSQEGGTAYGRQDPGSETWRYPAFRSRVAAHPKWNDRAKKPNRRPQPPPRKNFHVVYPAFHRRGTKSQAAK